MSYRLFKPVILSTGSCCRMWSADFSFASRTVLLYSKFTLPMLTHHGRHWGISWRLLIGEDGSRGRDESPAISCLVHVFTFCISLFTGLVAVRLFPATPTRVAPASSTVTGYRYCDIYPYSVIQSSPTHSVCWVLEAELFPSLLTRMLKMFCYPVHVLVRFRQWWGVFHNCQANA